MQQRDGKRRRLWNVRNRLKPFATRNLVVTGARPTFFRGSVTFEFEIVTKRTPRIHKSICYPRWKSRRWSPASVSRWFRHDGFSSLISLAQTIVDEEYSCRCSYIVCEISRCLGWHCRVVNELFTRSVSMIFVRLPDSLFTLAPFVS